MKLWITDPRFQGLLRSMRFTLGSSMSSLTRRAAGVIVILLTLLSFHFMFWNYAPRAVPLDASLMNLPEDFSWMSYVDQNGGLLEQPFSSVLKYFNKVGKQKGDMHKQVAPPQSEIEHMHKKMSIFRETCALKNISLSTQNLVIYRVSETDAWFLSLAKLNLMLFLTTIFQDPYHSPAPTFYVFSVANGDKNILYPYIPVQSNVAVLSWHQKNPSELLYNQLRTLEVVSPRQIKKFGAVFLLSVDVRGPLSGRYQNEWIQKYRFLLDHNNVAVVSPIIQCHEQYPQVPKLSAYALAVRTPFVLMLLDQFKVHKYKPASAKLNFLEVLNSYFAFGDDSLLSQFNFRAASVAQYVMDPRQTHYKDNCKAVPSDKLGLRSEGAKKGNSRGPVAAERSVYSHHAWCHDATIQMFIPWSKVKLRKTEPNCPNYVTSMYQYLAQFGHLYPAHTAQIEKVMGSINIYETVYGDGVRDVFVQYNEELRRLHLATNTTVSTNTKVVSALPAVSPVSTAKALKVSSPPVIVSVDNEAKRTKFTHTHPVPYTSANHYTHFEYDATPDDSQVCFLVRTSAMHDRMSREKGTHFTELDIFDFISSLEKQTNPNWRAYFFLTDDRPFSDRLKEIVLGARDSRIVFFDIDPAHRPKFTKIDAGYTATDYVLKHVLRDTTCKYITVTNGDNSYGSEIVQRVLEYTVALYGQSSSRSELLARHRPSSLNDTEMVSTTSKPSPSASTPMATSTGTYWRAELADKGLLVSPPMLLAPLDSRNFNIAYQNQLYKSVAYEEACRALNALLEYNMLTYTTQPMPYLGRVDLASLFLNREALLKANVLFANFTDPVEYSCHGCQDGYLAEHLTFKTGWEFARMPIDGLKSIVFHGPSPTLCVAGGNVWFDHPAVDEVGCYSRGTVHTLRNVDRALSNPIYDWENFDRHSGVCIRLSRHGLQTLDKRKKSYVTSVSSRTHKKKDSKNTLLSHLWGI